RVLEQEAHRARGSLCKKIKGQWIINRHGFLTLPPAIQRLVISTLLQEMTGSPYRHYSLVETVRAAAQKSGRSFTLNKRLRIHIDKNTLKLTN
ncbi:MAG: hypothetical protein NC823_01375, partial [Candidatus Omnitrophica bacterium]|nr:hypothetical protein [Candidatus Omnitrophota bacterium]